MVRFFFPLILVLLIAWLVVGIQNEKEKYNDNPEDSLNNFVDSMLKDVYMNNMFNKITEGPISFLLPYDFYSRTDITNESDAILQYSNILGNMFFILYSDPIASDSLAYNYSVENYARSTLDVSRKYSFVEVLDSAETELLSKQRAIKVSFLRIFTDSIGSMDTVQVSFITMGNNQRLFMLYWYARPATFSLYQQKIDTIIRNIFLKNE